VELKEIEDVDAGSIKMPQDQSRDRLS